VLPAGTTLRDLGAVRLKDLERPERIRQLLHDELPSSFPPPAGLDAYPHNLPVQLTPLVGRIEETATVALLVGRERLVTLTGSGGVGKTRLALAVAADAVDTFPGGVWFVELATVDGPGSTARATLKALDVPEAPTLPPAEQVVVELGEREPALIVLDNCEHLLTDAAAMLTELLNGEPTVTVLTTSREPLGVPGEIAWRVPSLTGPPATEWIQPSQLDRFESIALFAERARRARPSFAITDDNAEAVVGVCRRLDGIPLAIELAAARCRHLSPQRILSELDERFHLLTSGTSVTLPRQRTLRSSVEWSHDLLDDDERKAFRRLGIFVGRFTLDAAEAIASSPGDLDPISVFDTVARLVDKSLLLFDDRNDSYRMLETMRSFAVERADEEGELGELRELHARWWQDRLREIGIIDPTTSLVEYVDANLDDIISALSWTIDHDRRLGIGILITVGGALQGVARAGDAMPACRRLLLEPGAESDHPKRWLLASLAAAVPIASYCGEDAFVDLLERCEIVAERLDDAYHLSVARWLLDQNVATSATMIELARERNHTYTVVMGTIRQAIDTPIAAPDIARQTLDEAVEAANDYGSDYARAWAAAAEGVQELVYGDLQLAIERGRRLRIDPTPAMRSWSFLLLGVAGLFTCDADAVRDAHTAVLHDAARKLPGTEDRASFLDGIAEVVEAAGASSEVPLELPDIYPDMVHPIEKVVIGRLLIDRGRADEARQIFDDLAAHGPVLEAARQLAVALLDDDDDDWHAALRTAVEHGFRLIAVDALEGLGVSAANSDNAEEALRLFGAADRLRRATGYRWRFPFEQERYEAALETARSQLGSGADDAWDEGTALGLIDAAEYAGRARGERKRPRHGWASLTPTEQKVVALVTAGHSNPEIARQLLMSRSTVKTHLEHIYDKIGIRNRAELAAQAARRKEHNSS
jgi:predicted ATPase/DNA-binding CsgD family transcriptional regulator